MFGYIGFEIKRKFIKQKDFLLFIESFLNYLYLNISIYKNNLDEIINNYLIQQNNKNAKYVDFLLKNNNLKRFDEKFYETLIYKEEIKYQLNAYFFKLGKGSVESECENAKGMISFIKNEIAKTNDDIKQKGDLYFKIWLAIGVVVDIILWWKVWIYLYYLRLRLLEFWL